MVARRSAAKRADDPVAQNGVRDNHPEVNIGKKGRLCTDAQFRSACMLASKDPAAGADRMQHIASTNVASDGQEDADKQILDNMVELASLCITGLSGPLGSRKSLRHTAVLLVDKVLAREPDHAEALCLKGEMLVPRSFYGFPGARGNPPLYVLEEAFSCFSRAAETGSNEGKFLKGRYMVTMAPKYRKPIEEKGKALVEEAAQNGSARALVFLAQRLEFISDNYGNTNSYMRNDLMLFGKPVPAAQAEREKIVYDLYKKAADMGNGDALNDVGSCYATGFGNVGYDFDTAVQYYVMAIDAGSLHAFDNLGTHYEYGMSGKATDRIDLEKAAYYYRAGAKMRCSKCAMNLASSYEEGLYKNTSDDDDGDGNNTNNSIEVIEKDPVMSEKYLKYAIAIANDDDDSATATQALKDLVIILITRMKLNHSDEETCENTLAELKQWLPKKIRLSTLSDVNKSILKALKEDSSHGQLATMMNESSALKIFTAAKKLVAEVKKANQEGISVHEKSLKWMFGDCARDAVELALSEERSPKRRRSSN